MSASPRSTISIEQITALCGDREAALDLSKRIGRLYRNATGKVQGLTVDAALSTYAAQRSGILKFGTVAGTHTLAMFGGLYGVSHSTVILWKRLGVVLVDCGIAPESDLFKHLAWSGSANNSEIAKVLEGDNPTLAKVQAVWDTIYTLEEDDKGTVKVVKRDKTPGTPDGSDKVAKVLEGKDPNMVALACVKALSGIISTVDAATFAKVESALTTMLADSIAARTKTARQAAAEKNSNRDGRTGKAAAKTAA